MKRNYHKPKILIPSQQPSSPQKNEPLEEKKEDASLLDFKESLELIKDFDTVINDTMIISTATVDSEFSLIITNGLDKMFRIPLTQELMQDHRDNTGIEGTWTAYFQLLKQALNIKSLTLTDELLKIHYPLMVGAKVTGTFKLNEHEVLGRKRHEILQQMLLRSVTQLITERSKP